MSKDGIKHYPLNRYVVQRDGNGNIIEIVTKELIDRSLVKDILLLPRLVPNALGDDGMKMGGLEDDVEVYTHVKLDGGQWKWDQEVWGQMIPDSRGSRPKNSSPWIVLMVQYRRR